jgi:hypothetical protein
MLHSTRSPAPKLAAARWHRSSALFCKRRGLVLPMNPASLLAGGRRGVDACSQMMFRTCVNGHSCLQHGLYVHTLRQTLLHAQTSRSHTVRNQGSQIYCCQGRKRTHSTCITTPGDRYQHSLVHCCEPLHRAWRVAPLHTTARTHTITVHTNPGPSRSHRVYLGYHSGQLQHISAVDCVKVHWVEVLDTHLIAVTRGSCGKDGRGRGKNRGSHITFISSLTWRVDCAAWWCDTLELHLQCILTHMSREGQACAEPHSLTEGVAHCAGHCNRPPGVALPHVSRHMCIRQKGIAAPAVQARVAADVLCTGYQSSGGQQRACRHPMP